MKNSTQLFSTVSLLVLLSATPANLWGMTNEGTEDDTGTTTQVKGPDAEKDKTGTGTGVVAIETPKDEKTEVAQPKSGGWSLWPFSWGSFATPEDVTKGGTHTVTPQDAAKAVEDLKDAALKVIGMTREEFENATAEDLETHIKNDALSDAERQFLREAISAKNQQAELLLTASQLAAATPAQLKELKKDPELPEDMQQLAASALEVKKKGGTEEEQTAKIVAKATEEWGWGSTVAYYTLGAPVTIPYELMKGVYYGVTGAFSYAFGGSTTVQPNEQPSDGKAVLPDTTPSDPVLPVADQEATTKVDDTAQSTQDESVTQVDKKEGEGNRAQRRTATKKLKKLQNKQRADEQRKATEEQRAANQRKLRARLAALQKKY